jgi:hypothetical protein
MSEKEEPKETSKESIPDEAAPSQGNLVSIRSKNFVTLVHYLEKQDINPAVFLHTSRSTIRRISEGKQNASFFAIWRLQRSFSKISYRLVRNGKEALPENEDYGFEQKTAKLRYLDKYLVEHAQGLTLARAMSLSDFKSKNLKSGYTLPSKALCHKIADYFFLPAKMLLNDEEKLPAYKDLKIDDDLAAVQRNDLAEQMNTVKHKHFIQRNYRVLSHPMRVKLFASLLLMLLPLAAFTGYSAYRILQNRQESIAKFSQDSADSTSLKFQKEYIDSHNKTTDPSLTYCDVKVGLQVLKIFNIKPSNEYFSAALKLWFDFSQDDFHTMYKTYLSDSLPDADAASHISPLGVSYSQDMDSFSVASDNSVSYGPDSIPDYIELATPFDLADVVSAAMGTSTGSEALEKAKIAIASNPTYTKIRTTWDKERMSYPGLHPSPIYQDYSPNFTVGKGVDESTLLYNYAPGEPYYLSNQKNGLKREYRFFQCLTFCANVSKAYDNPRYPLETAQFWINIEPKDWLSVDHVRYQLADVVDVSRGQDSGTSAYQYCSMDAPVYTTMGDEVAYTDGFRPIKENDFKSHFETIEYSVDSAYPEKSYSKFTVVCRANRAAFTEGNLLPSTFLQTYMNLVAVILWIIIGFYNQTYANEDSLGMLGTGMFSAISATIVGFQMLSDASMFSLITMINIFTLAVILIMTYQAVMSKKANARQDKALIAYYGVKLRVTYYILTICTAVMFIGLPIAAYIWTV